MSQRMPNGSTSHAVFSSQQCGSGTISLRYQLAQDGCAESQFSLAKSLLEETTINSTDRETSAQIAIHWLLRAAEKGNICAFHLLKRCYIADVGINCDNLDLVVKCLRLPKEEIIARRITFALFSTMSDVENDISEDIFQEKVQMILKQEGNNVEANTSDNCFKSPPQDILSELFEPNIMNEPLEKRMLHEPLLQQSKPPAPENVLSDNAEESGTFSNEPCISVGDVITSVRQCLEGSLPLVALKHVAEYEEYNKFFSFKYALKFSNLIRNALIKLVIDLGSANLTLSIMLYSLFLFLLEPNITPFNKLMDHVFLWYFISAVVMISTSCYVIHLNIGLISVNRWLDLIKLFDTNIKTNEIKQKYITKAFYPLLAAFTASITFNIFYPFNSIKTISGELAIMSFVLTILLDRTISHQRYHVNVSLLLNILLCLNKEKMFCDIDFGLLNYINLKLCFPFYTPFVIHLNLLSCLIPIALPYLYWKMASGGEKHGVKLVLFPHFLCLIWLNLASNFYQTCENNIFYSIFFWLTVLLFTPIMGATLSLVLVSIAKGLYLTNTLTNISLIITYAMWLCPFLLCLLLVFKVRHMFGSKIVSLITLIAFLSIVLMKTSSVNQPSPSYQVLPWEKYETYCHRHAWYRSNTAEVQIACLPLKGKKIAIEGTVTEINVINVENHMSCFLSMFPSFISHWLRCALGGNFCEKENLSTFEKERCLLYNQLNIDTCHLHNWDIYQFQIVLEVSSRTSPEVVLKADHSYSAFIKMLKEGDSLNVVGILDAAIGSALPEILLEKATCSTCHENENMLPKNTGEIKSRFDADLSLHHMVKFYFSPFIQSNS